MTKFSLFTLIFLLFFGLCPVEKSYAQSGTYMIQVKDVLKVSFWEYADLNATVTVERDGGIDLPLVGKLTAAGLTINVLRQKIISQMSLYNKVVTQISIEVLVFGNNVVHVTGQVRTPGKYSFEEIPNLWDILLEAGGPLENASLNDIFIVRAEEGGKIYRADITEALENAQLDNMIKIKPGDTIQLQALGTPGITTSPLIKQDLIYIFGAVRRQGPHRFEAGSNILQAIGKAGGPASDANLKKVKHISVSHGTTSIVIIDLEQYMNQTTPLPMPLGPGDYVIIPKKAALGSRLLRMVITTTVTTLLGTTLFFLLQR